MKLGVKIQEVFDCADVRSVPLQAWKLYGTRMRPESAMTRAAIYLDHNASSPLRSEARDAMLAALDMVGNPSSVHAHGRALRNLVETGRRQVAELAGAEPKQVVFTGSATEAITQAILGGARTLSAGAIALSAGEHAAVGKAAEATGLPVWTIPLDIEGRIDLDQLAATLQRADDDGSTLLVALHWVNNETGVVQPIERINAIVGPTRHTLFIDAVQAYGKLPLDFASSAPDMMAISGHKIGAPAGIGALLMKSHTDSVRLIPGGGQEQGRRGGTESAALIAAFGAAAAATEYDAVTLSGLVQHIETGLQKMTPDLVVFGQGASRIGNVTNFAVPELGNATAMMALDLMGLSVSSGSACSSGKVGASHVLAAMGVAKDLANCALRVSFGWNSTMADADAFLAGFETLLTRQKRGGKAA